MEISGISDRQVKSNGPLLLSPGGTLTGSSSSSSSVDGSISTIFSQLASTTSAMSPSHDDSISRKNQNKINRECFGGAITLKLPACFEDVSAIRDVPDHQEVYVDKDTDMSLILELLNYEDTVSDSKAGGYFFDDIASYNEATNVTISSNEMLSSSASSSNQTLYAPNIPGNITRIGVIGRQTCTKFRESSEEGTAEVVQIIMLLLRLKSVGTDLLLTLNIPASAFSVVALRNYDSFACLHGLLISDASPIGCDSSNYTSFLSIVNSLEVRDWSLFA